MLDHCKTCDHIPEDCDKCYPELGYKNTKLERDTRAVERDAGIIAQYLNIKEEPEAAGQEE